MPDICESAYRKLTPDTDAADFHFSVRGGEERVPLV